MSTKAGTWAGRLDRADSWDTPGRDGGGAEILRWVFENILVEGNVAHDLLLDAAMPIWKMSGGGRSRPKGVLTGIQRYLLSGSGDPAGDVAASVIMAYAGGDEECAIRALYDRANALGSPPPWPMDLMFHWAGPPDRYENEGWRERQRAYFNERLAGHEEKRRARG